MPLIAFSYQSIGLWYRDDRESRAHRGLRWFLLFNSPKALRRESLSQHGTLQRPFDKALHLGVSHLEIVRRGRLNN